MELFILLAVLLGIALVGMTIYNMSGSTRRRTVVVDRPVVDEVVEDEVEVVRRPRRVVRRDY